MKENEWIENFKKLCLIFQKRPDSFILEVGKTYYENTNGTTSKLGELTSFEFSLLLDYLRDNQIKPDHGAIPQYYQLLKIWEENVRPIKIHDELQHQTEFEDCQLCDNTGFVPMYDLETTVEFVCGCWCKTGEQIIENAKKRPGDKRVSIIPYSYYRSKNRYILQEHVDENIIKLSKELAQKQQKMTDQQCKMGKERIQEILKNLTKRFEC